MTPEKFKELAQKIYDECKGEACEDGHIAMDDLMSDTLIELGYGEGIDILYSMIHIWYA